MSVVQDAQGQREVGGVLQRSRRFALLDEPPPLIGYVLAVVACYLALTGLGVMRTPFLSGDITLFAALMACGAICVEATRRLGQPSGVWRDLLSAWWLPVALLLPPSYALAAPAVLGLLSYVRVRQGVVYRRVFSIAALGLAGACASALFRLLAPIVWPGAPGRVTAAHVTVGHVTVGHVTAGLAAAGASAGATGHGPVAAWLTYPGPNAWLMRPQLAAVAVASAIVFGVLNTGLVAIAAWLENQDARLTDMLWDRERMLLDLTETCVGILVTIACALSALLLAVALPPVVLLQRSLLHAQLKAQARTDPKTGVLNAGAWQAEAALAIARAQRRDEQLAVLLADVDHFKRVNDSHGHLTGDAVLKTLAAEIRQQVRESDLVGRFGGEEFVILLTGTTTEEACAVAERVRRGAAMVKVLTADSLVGVTVSIGVAALGRHGSDLFELLAASDLALYRAKDTGRDRVCLYDPADSARSARSAHDS
jgi:diguanylate cyclase (GGDEF)-like protein